MKKTITSLVLAFASLCSMAQTDVTSKYIQNPSFEQNGTDKWTSTNLVTQTNTSFAQKQGATYLERWVSAGNKVGSASIKQTIVGLEPGKYTLTVAAQNLDQNNKTANCTGAKIYAGSASTVVYTPDYYSVDFTHVAGDIEIGFSATNATGNWLAVDDFRLTFNGLPEVADLKPELSKIIESANKFYGDGTGKNADALKAAIDAADAAAKSEEATSEQVVEQINALNAAINEYRLDNVSEEIPIDYTSYITNPSFENGGTKGWTSESLAVQTNTSFTKKAGTTYLEKWVSAGNKAGNASIYQKIKIPNGVYKLTVAAQNQNQNNKTEKCAGVYIYAGDQQETVYTPDDYSVKFTSIAGEVEIGFKAEGATGNYVCVDNFRLYLIGKVDNAAIVAEIQRIVEGGKALQASMMSAKAAADLASAISLGEAITEESAEEDVHKAKKTLDAAIEAAQVSIDEYKALVAAIEKAAPAYDETKEGAAEFKAELDKADEMAKNAEATSAELAAAIVALTKAELAFNLANATHGAGTAVKVTMTNPYMPTGATEALMRAKMTGSNILEKGVCWSEEHEPTVLDDRTTEYHTLNGEIYHIRGLKSATVYYVRPYVMNKTYEVAYGDEVKIVTHPKGTCVGTWDGGAPDEAANTRCRNAINQTIEYFNQWTGIKGFTLSGHYGAGTPTADCSYGGWMRIGPNAGNQAIGTVIHETGHGVGVGTSARWKDTNVHNWKWYGREANEMYSFLEGKTADPWNTEFCMVGDGTHGWGSSASYDWFVNGADKDKHQELQYLGGCCLLYALFVDGLCPTSSYKNGLAGYTYNFDDAKKYYLMNKNAERGLGEGLLYQRTSTDIAWKPMLSDEQISDSAAWYMEFNPSTGYYQFKNAATGKYMTHAAGGSAVKLKTVSTKPGATENFQLMPDRTNVTVGTKTKKITTHGYWFTWEDGGSKAMQAKSFVTRSGYGSNGIVGFDFSDKATDQQWIVISEDELEAYMEVAVATGIRPLTLSENIGEKSVTGIYSTDGMKRSQTHKGFNIIRYSDGSSKKIFVE